jgi:hypothetical protein
MSDPPFRRVEHPPSLGLPNQNDSEPEILRRLLDQFDAREIRRQLAHSRVYRADDLVPGDQALPRLMRCIQSSDLDFRGRSLNDLVAQALAI